ncbi:MAG: phosphatidylserine decarboxylase family protein [Maribacter dokdonensis]|uniref:Phosphatidylserine decarboxylase proenzyme n=1 Tax=Maribacter dokdonensis TaxID=320912 RepID=A0A1H4JA43_9FLAO|nr:MULTISPECIES: phosphatidylserine decarboxylase family protein [Maribacter]HAF76470.1 phosphatidylserine decarboxylase family protein [Maribacter sp.]APA63456.1 phosphatidylserine decarboxylase [Maribacter sp. 1_2014MBL_MicDiv]KSA11693.1 Phosphatidylserine decarboxylase proenzyme [Maribacter dokdonensis DSW-8]MBU2899450.1 phosphatidylserine decarboxylase family protein [Maribacter dokdonensis]PHN93019.1 phosphatidylserine decarboxylase family protein [Maribacter sp. 6B07]|tara:strand:- start:468 stop:1151 length:684 start_codon:yes stop_codon:yes gene_type:complete
MFHREGQKIILFSFLLVGVSILLAHFFIDIAWLKLTVQILGLIILIIILQFFRNPKRLAKKDFNEILSPVDGKVVVIEEVEEKEYFKDKRRQVSIFMSPVNVHVTRYPASGSITFSKYHPGKYLVAWHPKSSEENERTTVVIKTPKFGEILYRQIAGALARRIVNYAEEGESVQQGDDAGFIKFGSRVDLFLPLDCQINVKLNQKVKGAGTCIATFIDPNEKDELTY